MSQNCTSSIINNHLFEVISYSGRGLFQQGQYQQCIQQKPNLIYNYITLYDPTSSVWVPANIGLCLPKQCSKTIVQNTTNLIFQKIKQPFRVYEINTEIDEYSYPYDWLFYLTLIILVTLLALSLISTIFNRNSSSKKQNKSNHTLFQCFDLKKSKDIFSYKHNQLNVLNGVKSLAMMWVVFGHQYVFGLVHSDNIQTYQHILLSPFFLIVEAGLIAVDTFFFVGGFLVTYSIMRNIKQKSKIGHYFLAILQRALRFWPSYMVIILIYYSIYLHLGSGPQWSNQQVSVKFCSKMWKPLIFLDNIIDNGESMCISWGWYLQNDMQIFLISVFVLFWYRRNKLQAKLAIVLLMLGSFIYNFYEAQSNEYKVNTHMKDFGNWNTYFNDVYIKPWTRCPPYLYGVLFGMIYLQKRMIKQNSNSGQNRPKKVHRIIMERKYRLKREIFGLVLSAFVIFIPRTLQTDRQWPQVIHSLYLSIGKFVFVFGLSLTIYPSLMGQKSFIGVILDTRLFNFVSKLLFWNYLIHLILIFQFDGSLKYDSYLNITNLYTLFCGHLVISVPFALLFTLIVELPFMRLQKILMNNLIVRLTVKNTANLEQDQRLVQQTQLKTILIESSSLQKQQK